MKGLQHMLDEDGERSMPVPQASGPILNLVKEFAAYRSTHTFPDIDKPLDNRGKLERSLPNDAGSTSNWWRDFIDRQPMDTVFELLKVSHHPLGCDHLTDLCAARIATKYLGWREDQKEAIFGPYPSAEEEKRLREEHKWAEDEPELFAKLVKHGVLPASAVPGGAAAAGGAGAGAGAGAGSA